MVVQAQFLNQSGIQATVQNYFDGFIGQKPELLRKAFHPHAKLIAMGDAAVTELLASDWFAKIEARRQSGVVPPVASAVVLGIDQAGDAAVAKVQIKFPTYEFVDYLSLLKTADGWVIVNKIYAVFE